MLELEYTRRTVEYPLNEIVGRNPSGTFSVGSYRDFALSSTQPMMDWPDIFEV